MILNGHTYGYRNIINGISTFVDTAATTVAAFATLTAKTLLGKGKRGARDASRSLTQWKLSIPTVATEATACSCVGDVLSQVDVHIEFRSDAASTQAHLQEALDQLDDLVANAQFRASVLQHTQPTQS